MEKPFEFANTESTGNKYLDSLLSINYAILHYGNHKLVSKVIMDKLQKHFHWGEIFLDSSFTKDFQDDFQKISGDCFKIINFEN